VEDLAAICLAALEHGVSGTVYNVSDGMPRTWREIGRRIDGGQLPEPETVEQTQSQGKRINTTKVRAMLQKARISLRHPDLFRALEDLQHTGTGTQAQRSEQ
jgi:nucleoside-diphosphate-sugar epimerase